jgi:hypothetical protein
VTRVAQGLGLIRMAGLALHGTDLVAVDFLPLRSGVFVGFQASVALGALLFDVRGFVRKLDCRDILLLPRMTIRAFLG